MMHSRAKQVKTLFCVLVVCVVLALFPFEYVLNINGPIVNQVFKRMRKRFATRSLWSSEVNSTTQQGSVLDKCPFIPKNFTRHISIDVNTLNSTEDQQLFVKPGGRYKPLDCESRHRVAVIVPYRDRENQLKIFLRYMHPFLQRQNLNYGIYAVESIPGINFNRALLLNTGFVEANKLYDYDCFIFHDVDLLPENDGIPYRCELSPLHLSVAIDVKKYKLPYSSYFGGVCAFRTEHFKKINGFSNIYFGWGGEDDDIYGRVKYSNMKVNRLLPELGRYKMLQHGKSKENSDKMVLFKSMKARYQTDGLNSLKYHVVKQEFKRLYTWILVSVNETEIMESEPIHKQTFSALSRQDIPKSLKRRSVRSHTGVKNRKHL